MYNRAVLMGRIAKDLELKTTTSGKSVTQFPLAVERRYAAKGEERETDFFNVVVWGQQAEFVCKYFHKGSMIFVEGELQNREYTDKNGVDRYVTEVVASHVSFTGEKNNDI